MSLLSLKSLIKREWYVFFMLFQICFIGCVAALLLVPINGQVVPQSPCPEVFSYDQTMSNPGRWYGKVTINSDTLLQSFSLNVILDKKADMLGVSNVY
jgi:hypothetical protein